MVRILDAFLLFSDDDSVTDHHEATSAYGETFAADVKSFYSTVKEHGGPFLEKKTEKLKHLTNGVVIEDFVANQEVLKSEEIGNCCTKSLSKKWINVT